MQLSPLSTLESSFDSINVKKFDGIHASYLWYFCSLSEFILFRFINGSFVYFAAAFAVDPLYHQTSAQFDEGGAKGLLLNNLGIYGTCSVLFDSCEIPGKSIPEEIRNDRTDSIDICFAKGLWLWNYT